MYQHGFVVPPLKKKSIYDTAAEIRGMFSKLVGPEPRLPLGIIYEVLPEVLPGFRLEICMHAELGNDHGRTFPEELLIQLREDVYDGMCSGNGRDRFTGAHELGHLFLHKSVPLARKVVGTDVPIYRNSEWQADTFASALLIDQGRLLSCKSIQEVMDVFGVSEAAARVRLK